MTRKLPERDISFYVVIPMTPIDIRPNPTTCRVPPTGHYPYARRFGCTTAELKEDGGLAEACAILPLSPCNQRARVLHRGSTTFRRSWSGSVTL